MLIEDIGGAGLTILGLCLLAANGAMLARAILRQQQDDVLAAAIATVVCSSGIGVLTVLALGIIERLSVVTAFICQAVFFAGFLQLNRNFDQTSVSWHAVSSRIWSRLKEHPVLSVLTSHLIAYELLRGLLRPPLSWDSLTYHLLSAATWLQQQNIAPFFGPHPHNILGLYSGNGSLWLWWWMAPSHSELYVNLAHTSHWILLGLCAGAIARELGARRYWPVASFLSLMLPGATKFVATQYVDIMMASMLLSGFYFGWRWAKNAEWPDALLAAIALGIAAGTKEIALGYCGAFVLGTLPFCRGQWTRRPAHFFGGMIALLICGGFFYFRKTWLGVGPLHPADTPFFEEACKIIGSSPNLAMSVWGSLGEYFWSGKLTASFLGKQGLELGWGPQALLLLTAIYFAPLLLEKGERQLAFFVMIQASAHLIIWFLVVPSTDNIQVMGRFLTPVAALGAAATIAILEHRGAKASWVLALAVMIGAQSLLQAHQNLTKGFRWLLAAVDAGMMLVFVLAPLKRFLTQYFRFIAIAAIVILVCCAPWLAKFRQRDRNRAFANEFTAHATTIGPLAGAFAWLDAHGGKKNVAVSDRGARNGKYYYPAMGMRLERRVMYVNINEANHRNVARYPNCDPRVAGDPAAWRRNLAEAKIGWLLLTRQRPSQDFPIEDRWARTMRLNFSLKYKSRRARIWMFRPAPSSTARPRKRIR